MENKQTAVEWLYDTIIIFPESVEDLVHNARSFKQAHQMEKEQTGDWVETHWYEEINSKNYKLYYNKNNEWK
jgi:hypothetical protein